MVPFSLIILSIYFFVHDFVMSPNKTTTNNNKNNNGRLSRPTKGNYERNNVGIDYTKDI